MASLLVIDDEYAILDSIAMFLGEKGYRVLTAPSIEEGKEILKNERPEILILDIRLPDGSGLDALPQIKQLYPEMKVIVVTAFHDMQTAIEAMKLGAFDYITKPLDANELEKAVRKAVLALYKDTELVPKKQGREGKELIVGSSPKMLEVIKTVGVVCKNRATVLIQGETGTGKELVARVIHQNSPFKDGPFVIFDCAGVVETLLESELFGHEKGAFTCAVSVKKGALERAEGGTLFLDEVGELPFGLQAKLLGFLQRREFIKVGGQVPIALKCRVIAATNRDLSIMVKEGKFREDLYYRLKVVSIYIPPLRERPEDIPDLVSHIMKRLNQELETSVWGLEKGVLGLLLNYHWPGNVRELENVLMEAMIRARGGVVARDDVERILASETFKGEQKRPDTSLELVEMEHITKILKQVNWSKKKAAEILGISLPTLRAKILRYGIKVRS